MRVKFLKDSMICVKAGSEVDIAPEQLPMLRGRVQIVEVTETKKPAKKTTAKK